MDIALAADTPCIPQFFGNRLYRTYDIALGVSLGVEAFDLSENTSRKNSAGPSSKIFRRKFLLSYLSQIIVYVTRTDGSALAFLVDILKKLLPRQVLAMIDNFREAAIVKIKTKRLAALPAKFKPDLRSCHFDVLVSHCGQSKRSIVPRVFLIADPDERCFEQLDNRRQHFLAR